jgi:hypothetical protein
MFANTAVAVVFGLAVMLAAVADKDKPSADDVKKAEKQVMDRLGELKATGTKVDAVSDDAVASALPGHLFFAVIFRQFPIARVPPDPLKAQNLFVVNPKGELKIISEEKMLVDYFKANLAPAKDERAAKEAGLAWLRLVQEFSQDGLYKFKTVEEGTKVTKEKEGLKVVARTAAVEGGNGEISVEVIFDADGKLTKATATSMLKPGPRPVCQATKLTDPDPLVRRICEQDLLIMGRLAKDYLDEQRAKADPELQKAIDRIWERIVKDER